MQKRVLLVVLCLLLVWISADASVYAIEKDDSDQVISDDDDVIIEDDQDVDFKNAANINNHTYKRYADNVYSYLVSLDNGFMQVDYLDNTLCIKYLSEGFEENSKKMIPIELPLFGGFYAGKDAYYIVSGQSNENQDDSREVIRIDKYDTSWNKLGTASVNGANTYTPFEAGSLRMAEYGGYLYVRTAHVMYAADNGVHHQSCITFEVDEASMQVVDSYYKVMNVTCGYVSHSFNQFIMVDDQERIVCLDHGDAGMTRAAVLGYYKTLAGNPNFTSGYDFYTYKKIMPYAGKSGNNTTGANLGGLTYSASNYLTVGRSVSQDSNFETNKDWNVYVTVSDRANIENTETKWLTSYTGSNDIFAGNPFITKMSEDRFLVCWPVLGEKTNTIEYAFIDGNGDIIGQVRSATACLSDCQMILHNGEAYWYVDNGYQTVYYSIDKDGNLKSFVNPYPGYHTVTIKTDAGGSINLKDGKATEIDGNIYSAKSGETLTFAIAAQNGYTISDVLVDGESVGIVSKYTIESIDKNHTIELVCVSDKENPQNSEPVSIDLDNINIVVKQKYDFGKSFSKYNVTKYKVESVEGGKASVNKNGLLKAKKPGIVKVIPLVKVNGKYMELKMDKPLMVSISEPLFDKAHLKGSYEGQIIKGSLILNRVPYGNTVKWSVRPSKKQVITVSENSGDIRVVQSGKAKIVATFTNDQGQEVSFVKSFVVKIPKLSCGPEITLTKGQTKTIAVKNLSKGMVVAWQGSRDGIVHYEMNGSKIKLRADNVGTMCISAFIDGHEYKTTVTVTD